MKIPIDNTRSISSLQEAFNNVFPYLRLEFSPGRQRGVAPSSGTKTADKLLGELRTSQQTGELLVSPQMTVADLELLFKNYGLDVRIFRKSGRVWLETGITHNWTLEQQNMEGENLSKGLEIAKSGLNWQNGIGPVWRNPA